MGSETDSETIADVESTFDNFYKEHRAHVLAAIYGIVGNRWAAEDLVQEAFLKALYNWSELGTMPHRAFWVRRVALNLAKSKQRRLRVEATFLRRIRHHTEVWDRCTPESEAFWAEVRKLPRRQCQAIALRYADELSVTEIAEVLQVSSGTIKAVLHQGRNRLARQLSAKGWIDSELR